MSSEHNEQKLKLALAGMLPDVIVYDALFERFHWKGKVETFGWPEIRDTEWLHVCHLVEQTLSEEDLDKYITACWDLKKDNLVRHILNQDEVAKTIWRWLTRLPWPLRAQALCIVHSERGGGVKT